MKINRASSQQQTDAGTEHFTGQVKMVSLVEAEDPGRVRALKVSFEKGARTDWHTHPLGQTLIIESGSGLVQTEGGSKEEINSGDVVWSPAGEKHWHGASKDSSMTHVAIQEALDGKPVDWLEKVTDEQYQE